MNIKNKKFYLISVGIIAVLSAYPVYMGVVTLTSYMQYGYVDAVNYPKYIIPYTPLSVAMLFAALLMPALYNKFKRYALPVASLIGAAAFLSCEIGLEQIKVVEGYEALTTDAWQWSLCVSTPEALEAMGKPLYAQGNPAYKVHFYIIALVILLAAINVFYGYTRMYKENEYSKRRVLNAQLICVAVFTGLCVFACFTAFYRTGTLDISPISSALMSVFFVAFGVTFGVYFATIFYGKKLAFSSVIPSVIASATAAVMYCGELVLMNGVLFKFGRGAFFEPAIGPFAPADIAVILLSGIATFIITKILNRQVVKSELV